ncbi:acetylornithine deacetylase [Methylohalobius crimeensis]|uniref:acetylornithine deacetylase n=1 Tax=Methylohalobius crimeensis TaxID=244365 RepID=UPI0003B36203|nr:acetylornithine deacetylase [Methylohalobius crimeensis]
MALPTPIEMIAALVGEPSVSSADPRFDQSNRGVVNQLAQWLDEAGFEVTLQAVTKNKVNLIATLGPAAAGEGLVLSGHTDTVPFDEGQWSQDPFRLTQRDGRLYGLGTADMKSFFALILAAVQEILPRRLKRPLVVLATADEESTMDGARLLADTGLPAGRFAVIGEPTDLKPVRMHKGVLMESVEVIGRSGHASNPALGANALEGMTSVLQALLGWRDELSQDQNPDFEVPFPTLNLGAIHGGDSPNRICGHCRTYLDLRLLPGMPPDAVRSELKRRVETALTVHPKLKSHVESLFAGVPAFETSADADLVRLCETLTGQTAGAVAFATEAPYLAALGLETIVLGAGSIDQAHQPDEYLSLHQIDPAIGILRRLIERHCLA